MTSPRFEYDLSHHSLWIVLTRPNEVQSRLELKLSACKLSIHQRFPDLCNFHLKRIQYGPSLHVIFAGL
jgi:hypothetical protein